MEFGFEDYGYSVGANNYLPLQYFALFLVIPI